MTTLLFSFVNIFNIKSFLQEIMKKVRGILNKLTPQKFQTLVTQVMDFDINTEERLKGTIDLTFEKVRQHLNN